MQELLTNQIADSSVCYGMGNVNCVDVHWKNVWKSWDSGVLSFSQSRAVNLSNQ